MRRLVLTFILILMGLVQVSCQNSDKDSILIIAVDDLVVADLNCVKEGPVDSKSGLDLLCKESVRFTHAFSPSTMSVPTISSMFTGLYPFQHGVRHNGQNLEAQKLTVAEAAVQRGYRTAFFSGGAPVLRKTGLNQGFEVFDDSIVPDFNSLFRAFGKSISMFEQWLRQDAGNSPFLATIYVPDLIFTNTETVSDMGEPRNFSYESQLDEFSENLYRLFQTLKKSNRWDHTTVILAGLNGHTSSDRPDETTGLNLHSENNQIALLIKPSQRKRDEGITWKVDKNVSLVDIGKTLFDMLKVPANQRPQDSEEFPIQSLIELLKQPEASLSEERPLLIESAWGAWKGLSNIRSAIVKNHALFINDEKTLIYNTLVDRFETNPLPVIDSYTLSPHSVMELLQKNNFTPWTGVAPVVKAKMSLSYTRWMKPDQNLMLIKDIKNLLKKYPYDRELEKWLAEVALELKEWPTLRAAGIRMGEKMWTYAAEKNLGIVQEKVQNPCLQLLREKRLEAGLLKSCNDPLMLDFIDWIRADARGLSKEFQRKKFERSYRTHRIDITIRRSNIGIGQIWDINKEIEYAPTLIDLVLNLPEYQRIRTQLEKSIRLPVADDE